MAEGRNEFPLPPLGGGATEATIVRWAIDVGDRVVIDRPICSVDANGVVLDLTSPFAGTVTALGAEAGQAVAVGEMLLAVSDDAVNGPTMLGSVSLGPPGGGRHPSGPDRPVGSDDHPTAGETDDAPAGSGDHEAAEPERARALDGDDGENRPHDGGDGVRDGNEDSSRPQHSPLVRRLADDFGVDLAEMRGTGPGGRITRDDVHRAAFPDEPLPGQSPTGTTTSRPRPAERAEQPEASPATVSAEPEPEPAPTLDDGGPAAPPTVPAEPEPEPAPSFDVRGPAGHEPAADEAAESGVRERGQRRATFSLAIEVDARQLVRAHERLADSCGGTLGFDALLLKLVATAATGFEELRTGAEQLPVGFLRAHGSELVADVVNDVADRSVTDVERVMSDRVRQHQPGDEPIVAPLTVVDAGDLGVTAIGPPLPLGGAVVVAIGTVTPEPGRTATVAATFDEDEIDLVRAATFLQALRPYLEDPILAFAH